MVVTRGNSGRRSLLRESMAESSSFPKMREIGFEISEVKPHRFPAGTNQAQSRQNSLNRVGDNSV